MAIKAIVCSIAVLMSASLAAENRFYNILAIDGGGIRGIIPGVVLRHLEEDAYKIAEKRGWLGKIPKYPGQDKKMALKDIFHMFAGTSTGSILAAGLSYKHETELDKPKFWAQDLLDIYAKQGETIF